MTKLLLDWSGEIIAALGGAFFGAGAAFLLQKRREDQLKADREYAAIIKAQHAILFMWRILASIQYTYLDAPRKDVEFRHRKLPKYWVTSMHLALDLDSIAFLFRPKMREVVSNCFFAQRAFLSAIEAVTERNAYWDSIVAQSGDLSTVGPDKMAQIVVNPIKDSLLKSATDALYKSVETGMALCERAFGELRKNALIVFPDRDFLKEVNLTEAAIRKDLDARGQTSF